MGDTNRDGASDGASYGAARRTGDAVAGAIEEIAALIGPVSGAPIVLQNGETVPGGLDMHEDAVALLERARDLRQGLFSVIVLGEFKNGKSTLLNAMLGIKKLPAKAAPATAIITVLVAGDRDDVAIYETGRKEPRRVSWDDFVREFQLTPADQETIQEQGILDRFASVEYAEIETSHELCSSGVKLVDSPGLGEHISRTRVATDFLKRSQAVVMVLNATRILTRDERDFIQNALGAGDLSHVFFVVNRIDQIDEQSLEEIKPWLKTQLACRFTREDGVFDDDLYNRRVFFLSAKRALDARSDGSRADNDLEDSGLPAFERELERFLTSEERVAAIAESTAQVLAPTVRRALERIAQTRGALDEPLRDLEKRREEAEQSLKALETRRRDTERTILLFGDTVKRKVFSDLTAFVDALPNTWEEDSRRLMDLDSAVSFRSVISSYTQREARERLASAVNVEVQRYVQAKFESWSNRVPSLVEPDVAIMMNEVQAQMNDLQLELDRIAGAFAGTSRPTAGPSGQGLLQLALSYTDVANLTDEALGIDNIGALLGRVVQNSIIVHLVRTFFIGSYMIATIVVQALHSGLQESEVKRRIRQGLGERLIGALKEQIAEREGFIYESVEERFRDFAGSATKAVTQQIEQVRVEQTRILDQRRDERFSVERERQRLAVIERELGRIQSEMAANRSLVRTKENT